MPDPVDAADVLAEALPPRKWLRKPYERPDVDRATKCLQVLSERAGGGAFACVPGGTGGWTLYRIVEWPEGTCDDLELATWDLPEDEAIYRLMPVEG